jgi:ATP-binding cassette subfamily C protein CydC
MPIRWRKQGTGPGRPFSELIRATLPAGQVRWLAVAVTLAVLAALSAVGLVAASGWLITASGIAGMATGVAMLEIFAPGALIRLFAVSRTVSRYFERVLGHDALLRMVVALRSRLFMGQSRLGFEQLWRLREGAALTRLVNDTQQLEQFHAQLAIPLVAALATGLVMIPLLAGLTGPLAATLLAAAFLATLLILLPRRSPEHLESRHRLDNAGYRRQVLDVIAAHQELYFAYPDNRVARSLIRRSRRIRDREAALARNGARRDAMTQLTFHLAIPLMLLIAGLLSGSRLGDEPAWLALSVFAVLGVAGTLAGLGTATRQWTPARVAARELFGRKAPATRPEASVPDRILPAPCWQLQAVHLSRGVTDSPVLDRVNLNIEAREQLTVTGASGAGKSRLAALLAGLIVPDSGRVTLDGTLVANLPEARRFATVSLLEQHSCILDATLRHNLAAPDAGISDQVLWEAVQATELSRTIPSLDTVISENGRRLSGGEARRVCLIRAVMAGTPAVILDEPFRGLDAHTRGRVAAWLARILKGRTVILLDHSPHPLLASDRCLRISRGRIDPITC